jgi:tetratricopeptide (TPR) repeat protein/DNA-binding MarR family transcriptional regulator
MSVAGTHDLLLATLARSAEPTSGAETTPSPDGSQPLSAVLRTIGSGDRRLSQQVELVAAIDALIDEGLVERTTSGEGVVLALTDAGTERAREVQERLATTSIELVEGDHRRELTLKEAAAELDRSLIEVATECSDGCVYHHDESPGEGIVGRERERQVWSELVDRVNERRSGAAALLTGPGGIGKTTLAEAFLTIARQEGLDVLRARCHGPDSEPYQPLRTLLEGVPTEANLFDGIGVDVRDAEAFEAQQTALFHDITETLTPTEVEPPRVVYLDDLHLAGPATLAYLAYLLDRLSERSLLLLGSYRPSELPQDAPVAAGNGPEAASITHLELSTLDRETTRGVIERVLGRRGVPDAFLSAIHERTGGNPLFVESVVEHLLETDQLDARFEWYPDDPNAIEVPDRVRDTIRERVDALGRDTRELLSWAAVAGESVPVPVLQQVSDVPAERLSTLLSVLVEAELFDWPDDHRRVTFVSEVVREALLAALDDEDRQHRHSVIAAALETADASDEDDSTAEDEDGANHAATIAHHHERADNVDAAIEWYRTAADRATDVYAHESAIEHTHRALALARTADRETELLTIGTCLAERYLMMGSYDEAERFVRFVRERVPGEDTAERQSLAHLAAEVASARGEYGTAIEEATAGLALDDEPTPERYQLLDIYTTAERQQGNYEDARALAEQQRDLASRIDDTGFEATALLQLGSIAERASAYDEAEEYLQQSLERYRTMDDRRGVADTQFHLGTVAQLQRNLAVARTHYRQAISEYEAVGDPHGIARTRLQLGIVAGRQRHYDDARAALRQAREELQAVGDRHSLALVHHNLGNLASEQGAYEEAHESYREALEGYREVGDRHSITQARNNLGDVALHQGAYDEAREQYLQTLQGYREVDDQHLAALTRSNLARVDAGQGAYDEAQERARNALAVCRDVGQDSHVGWALFILGLVARRVGARDRAHDRLHEALDTFRAADDQSWAVRPRIELGALAREHGDYETAEEHLDTALETATEIGDRHGAARCHGQLGASARQQGERDRASERLQQAQDGFQAVGDRHGLAITRLRRGRLARDRGEYESGRALCVAARETFEAISATHWIGRADHALGTVAAATDDVETAIDRFERALDTFEDIGAAPDAAETAAELVDLSAGESERRRTS